GHTGGNRLDIFVRKPAPIQVTYLGHPNTTGLTSIDYRLTDPVADPAEQPSWCTEELVRLPGCFCCFGPPSSAPDIGPLPASRSGFVTFGSFHNLAKLNDDVLDLWAEILRTLPSAHLLIYRDK